MIILNNNSSVPLYLQIYEQIKEKIISGEISEGSKLPSTRMLSLTLSVSRNTVESAYLQLCSEGYVESKAGSGFIVQRLDALIISKLKMEGLKKATVSEKAVLPERLASDCKYNFEYGSLNASDFPLQLWKKISNKCLSSISAEDMTSYGDGKGEMELRTEIMKYLNKSRGVSCRTEQVIISSGMEYSLSIISQLFRMNFQQIALEDPGYTGARDIFINNGYDVIPISLEKDGINLEELELSSVKIVYVTPSHQFPTGTVMPISKRLKLLDWAVRKNGIIIEDDYDSELRYNSRPVPAIQGIDTNNSVIYIGTFSKALSPSLRVNYMVLPQGLLERYDRLFKRYQAPVPIVQQKIIQQFMNLGYWERHLRKICLINKRKYDILINVIHEIMGDRVTIYGRNAGIYILLEVHNGLNEEELIEKAKDYGISVMPVSIFWMRRNRYPDNMVMLGFGAMTESEIAKGIELLKEAWFGCE